MLTIGCHLSSSKGYLAMGKEAVSIGANTFQFFTRNPRGSKAKAIDEADVAAFLSYSKEHGIERILAHAPYTLNPCSKDAHTREFAWMTMADDLKRLGIGMALVGEPDVLVLDEPINGLDPEGIAEVRETLLRLNKEKGLTIIISSHILEELSKIATNYAIIDKGQLVKELSREELEATCREHIEIKMEHPDLALPVLDALGFKDYRVADENTIHILDR